MAGLVFNDFHECQKGRRFNLITVTGAGQFAKEPQKNHQPEGGRSRPSAAPFGEMRTPAPRRFLILENNALGSNQQAALLLHCERMGGLLVVAV